MLSIRSIYNPTLEAIPEEKPPVPSSVPVAVSSVGAELLVDAYIAQAFESPAAAKNVPAEGVESIAGVVISECSSRTNPVRLHRALTAMHNILNDVSAIRLKRFWKSLPIESLCKLVNMEENWRATADILIVLMTLGHTNIAKQLSRHDAVYCLSSACVLRLDSDIRIRFRAIVSILSMSDLLKGPDDVAHEKTKLAANELVVQAWSDIAAKEISARCVNDDMVVISALYKLSYKCHPMEACQWLSCAIAQNIEQDFGDLLYTCIAEGVLYEANEMTVFLVQNYPCFIGKLVRILGGTLDSTMTSAVLCIAGAGGERTCRLMVDQYDALGVIKNVLGSDRWIRSACKQQEEVLGLLNILCKDKATAKEAIRLELHTLLSRMADYPEHVHCRSICYRLIDQFLHAGKQECARQMIESGELLKTMHNLFVSGGGSSGGGSGGSSGSVGHDMNIAAQVALYILKFKDESAQQLATMLCNGGQAMKNIVKNASDERTLLKQLVTALSEYSAPSASSEPPCSSAAESKKRSKLPKDSAVCKNKKTRTV